MDYRIRQVFSDPVTNNKAHELKFRVHVHVHVSSCGWFFWQVCQCIEFKMSDQLVFVCNDEKCPWGTSSDEIGVQCGAQEKASFALGKYFKRASFRPGQLDAVLPLMLYYQHSTRRMFLLGWQPVQGSVCMYLVPLASGNSAVGIIIISPLIGLIGQQVRISVKCTM